MGFRHGDDVINFSDPFMVNWEEGKPRMGEQYPPVENTNPDSYTSTYGGCSLNSSLTYFYLTKFKRSFETNIEMEVGLSG